MYINELWGAVHRPSRETTRWCSPVAKLGVPLSTQNKPELGLVVHSWFRTFTRLHFYCASPSCYPMTFCCRPCCAWLCLLTCTAVEYLNLSCYASFAKLGVPVFRSTIVAMKQHTMRYSTSIIITSPIAPHSLNVQWTWVVGIIKDHAQPLTKLWCQCWVEAKASSKGSKSTKFGFVFWLHLATHE